MGSEGDQTWKAMSAFLFFQEESKIFFFFDLSDTKYVGLQKREFQTAPTAVNGLTLSILNLASLVTCLGLINEPDIRGVR